MRGVLSNLCLLPRFFTFDVTFFTFSEDVFIFVTVFTCVTVFTFKVLTIVIQCCQLI